MPGSSAELFLDYIDAQDLPMDTLAARGKRYDAVEILTPALAAGRHWQTVYVCGLQDGPGRIRRYAARSSKLVS